MPKSSQRKSEAMPKYPGLWERITAALKTDKTSEIARLIGVKDPSVSEWKKGKPPSLDSLIKIARLGNTSIEELLMGNEAMPNSLDELEKSLIGEEFEPGTDDRILVLTLRNMMTETAHDVARQVFRNEIALMQGNKLTRVPETRANVNESEQREESQDRIQERAGRGATGGRSKH
jgi:transcriptional regulator with XRE-family HTH domain